MKTLIILRHGKAELQASGQDDYDRSLTARGEKNAAAMGVYISKKQGIPELMLSSAAKRAYQTAALAAKGMGYPEAAIESDENFYLVSDQRLLKALSTLPAATQSCVLVGHNPGLTDLVNYFGVRLDNLPTASAVCLTFQMDTWENIASENAEFQWLKLAKEL